MEENDRMPNGYGCLTNKVSVGLADLAFASSLPISSFFGSVVDSQSSSSWSADEQTNTTHTRSHQHGLDTTRPRPRHAEVRYIRPALTKACSTRELALSNTSLSLGPFPSCRLLTPRTVDRRVVVTGPSFRFISPRRKRISPT